MPVAACITLFFITLLVLFFDTTHTSSSNFPKIPFIYDKAISILSHFLPYCYLHKKKILFSYFYNKLHNI